MNLFCWWSLEFLGTHKAHSNWELHRRHYQNFHEQKSSGETDDEVVVDVNVVATVGALVHMTNVAVLDLKIAQNCYLVRLS